ncbi:putative dehydrogenase [Homoserinimonas aerilata]|uniref:Putative dehydrogenase n=1 Tax=Homoserinimonas aerilata TaxID=1162970 RepID=A0A542YL79_9MICO|nr:Gfo/Idh/MocA family oxidoreductase [Homoserinimonas aerilata]TQL48845.1 putative dehydrogenase [Homoserinimonas aerilata]
MKDHKPLGVGILGAGPVTQAIHLPTLKRLPQFDVVHVMDIDADVANAVAARADAEASTTATDVMGDPRVEVVAICSPPAFHAAQVLAAIDAGKRGILCEKPFATSREEAMELADVAQRNGVPIVVGAMHTYDPAWDAVSAQWDRLGSAAHSIRSSIVLPMNSRFEDWATEIHHRAAPSASGSLMGSSARSAMLHAGIMGLAIHNLPLLRRFMPTVDEVMLAELFTPFGYHVTLRSGEQFADLFAYMHHQWRPDWTLDVWGDTSELHLEFPPSYVHAGSAVASLRTANSLETFGPYDSNGYEAEWGHLAALIEHGGRQNPAEFTAAIDDLTFAIDIADRAAAMVLAGSAA